MITATIFEAKTNLSELLKKARGGEKVLITSGREKTPVAQLLPVEAFKPKRLGLLEDPNFELTEAFWEPLTDEQMGYTGEVGFGKGMETGEAE